MTMVWQKHSAVICRKPQSGLGSQSYQPSIDANKREYSYSAKACMIAQIFHVKIIKDKIILTAIILTLGCGIDALEMNAHSRSLAVKKASRA